MVRQQTETTLEENKNKVHCWWHFVLDSLRIGLLLVLVTYALRISSGYRSLIYPCITINIGGHHKYQRPVSPTLSNFRYVLQLLTTITFEQSLNIKRYEQQTFLEQTGSLPPSPTHTCPIRPMKQHFIA